MCVLIVLVHVRVQVPSTLEIGLVTRGQFPGLYLMSSVARMVRPVLNLTTNTTEMIGSFEQVTRTVQHCVIVMMNLITTIILVSVGIINLMGIRQPLSREYCLSDLMIYLCIPRHTVRLKTPKMRY